MFKSWRIIAFTAMLLLLFLFLGKVYFIKPLEQTNKITQPDGKLNKAASLKAGKQVFLHNCIACHGEDGRKGVLSAFDLSQSKLTREQRLEVITNGRNAMPTFKTQLTPAQINAVANYITLLRI